MRIALVHSFYDHRLPSGENNVVEQQAAALERHGAAVRLIGRHTADGGRLHALTAAASVSTGMGPSPLEELAHFRPDVVHLHNIFPNWGAKWLERVSAKLIVTLHNFRPLCSAATLFRDGQVCMDCPTSGTSRPAVRHACYRNSRIATLPLAWRTRGGGAQDPTLRNARRLVALSNRAADIYSRFGVPEDRLTVIPNFIRPPTAPLAGTVHGRAWIYVGRLTVEKGVLALIENWPATEELRVLGDGPLRDQVTSKANAATTCLGYLPREAVLGEMAEARGLIFPSLWPEGLPTVYLEALSMGLPVIALAGNSVADEVERTGTGIVIRSMRELPSAMTTIRTESDRYRAACFEAFDRHYTEQVWLGRMTSLYEEVAGA